MTTSLHDLLDAAADDAVAGRRLDAAAVVARSQRPEYRPLVGPLVGPFVGSRARRWRPGGPLSRPVGRGLLVAAAVLGVLVLVLAALPAVHRALPQPAKVPDRPGSYPRVLHVPPAWTPSAAEQPISRAVYVVGATPLNGDDERGLPTGPSVPWIVGADGGEYRLLPTDAVPDVLALSRDGRRVAWTEAGPSGEQRVAVLDVRTGAVRTVQLPGVARRGIDVTGLAFSPEGTWLAVWGRDGARRSSAPDALTVLTAARRGPVMSCRLRGTSFPGGVAWVSESVLVSDGGCGGQEGAAADRFEVRSGLGPLPADAVDPQGIGAPVGTRGLVPVVSGDGTVRWSVVGVAQDRSEDRPVALSGASPAGTAGVRVDLGSQSAAVVQAADADGVVVTRWRTDPRLGSGFGGPSDTVRVRLVESTTGPTGRVEVLSTTADPRVRVAAVAPDLLGAQVPGARPGPRVLDVDWWSAVTERVVGAPFRWVAGLETRSAVVWLVVLGLVAVVLLRRRLARAPRTVRAAAALALLALAATVVLPWVLPTQAAVPPRPAAGSPPVLPADVRDQRLVPPRAFDEVGTPRTTAVGIVFWGRVAGRQGVYATDAATGRLVRLDDLPVAWGRDALRTEARLAVSANGRWLSDGYRLVDLERATSLDLALTDNVMMSRGVSREVAILDDGTVAVTAADGKGRLYVRRPAGSPLPSGLVRGVTGVSEVRPAGPGRVLVRLFGEGDDTGSLVRLVDLSTDPATSVVLPGLEQQDVAAVGADVLVRATVDALVSGPLPGAAGRDRTVPQPGATDAVWVSGTEVVSVGSSADSDLVVSRTPLGAGGAASGLPQVLSRIDPALVDSGAGAAQAYVTVAAGVVAGAGVTDLPPSDPWWAGIPRL